jgi:2'-5' RNA ligase
MKRRIFIAINLPEEVKKRLAEWQARLRSDQNQNYGEVKWVKKDNLHITLIFIGYVTDDEMYEIINIVKETTKEHEPFMINLENIILGPPNKTPRMFWAQGEKSQELANLQADLQEKIEQRHGGKHAFRPHITLSRFKSSILKQLPKEVNEPFKAQIPVEKIEIMQSNLKRTGAEYSILESIPLGE